MKARRLLRVATLLTVALGLFAMPAQAKAPTLPPDFDPDNPLILDLEKYGKERPDRNELEYAFEQQFDALDRCVQAEKKRTGKQAQMLGDALSAVMLNPAGGRPQAVHARLPGKYDTRKKLRKCVRKATAGAPFPAYDGPPAVASFEFELDPGFIECEPDDERDECQDAE